MRSSLVVKLLSLFFLFWSIVGLVLAQGGSLSEYRLAPGDLVKIVVFGEEDLSLEARLGDIGTISYPLLGDLKVVGLTIRQLDRMITRKLKDGYLVSPKVNVSISEYRQFFVNGEVESPGGFPFIPGLTVQKAVSLAGGFTERASKSNIYLLRENDRDGKPEAVKLNSRVMPGDILTVEESFF